MGIPSMIFHTKDGSIRDVSVKPAAGEGVSESRLSFVARVGVGRVEVHRGDAPASWHVGCHVREKTDVRGGPPCGAVCLRERYVRKLCE